MQRRHGRALRYLPVHQNRPCRCQRKIPVEGIDLTPAPHWRRPGFLSAAYRWFKSGTPQAGSLPKIWSKALGAFAFTMLEFLFVSSACVNLVETLATSF